MIRLTSGGRSDGWLDLVLATATTSGGKLWRLLNNEGEFVAYHELTLSNYSRFLQLAVSDIDQDGRPDIVASHRSDVYSQPAGAGFDLVMWYRNTGVDLESGIPLASAANDTYIDSFSFGDLNEDGRDDLVYRTKFNDGIESIGSVMLALRQEGASFATSVKICDNAGPLHDVSALGVFDIDRDGDMDVVFGAGDMLLENIAVHRTHSSVRLNWAGISPSGTSKLITADLNGDGHDELIATSEGTKRILSYSTGNGTLVGPLNISTGGRVPSAITSADFNKDGWVDLAYLSGNELRTLLNYNGGGLIFTDTVVGIMGGVICLTAHDADMDGDVDLLAASPTSGAIRWYLNPGAENNFWNLQSVTNSMSGVNGIMLGQLIAGGRPEVMASAPSTPLARMFQYNGSSWVMKGSLTDLNPGASNAMLIAELEDAPGQEWVAAIGDNVILSANTGELIGSLSNSIKSLKAVDWNNDGILDVMAAYGGGVTLFLNGDMSSSGQWTSYQMDTQAAYQDVVPIDLNRDGLMDAVGVTGSGQLVLFINQSMQAAIQHTPVISDHTTRGKLR